MRFPAGQAIPTVYEIAADGAERLVPFDVRGEFVVVHDIARQLRLRFGREVLCIYNEGPPALGVNLGTYTASGAIDRVDKGSNDPTATGREP